MTAVNLSRLADNRPIRVALINNRHPVGRGVAIETAFSQGPNGMIYATGSRTLGEGEMYTSQDSDIHQISNLQADGADLITLHLYSPPLLSMNVYSLVDQGVTQLFDPINEDFAGGTGI